MSATGREQNEQYKFVDIPLLLLLGRSKEGETRCNLENDKNQKKTTLVLANDQNEKNYYNMSSWCTSSQDIVNNFASPTSNSFSTSPLLNQQYYPPHDYSYYHSKNSHSSHATVTEATPSCVQQTTTTATSTTRSSVIRTRFLPDSALPICGKCKYTQRSSQRSRKYCREKMKHTGAPWKDAFICITIDEACIDSSGRLIHDEGVSFVATEMQEPPTATMPLGTSSSSTGHQGGQGVSPATTAPMFQFQDREAGTTSVVNGANIPICSSCKKNAKAISKCRQDPRKHVDFPYTTSYHRMVPLRMGSSSSREWPSSLHNKNTINTNSSLYGDHHQSRSCNTLVFDSTQKIPASRTFILKISSKSCKFEWARLSSLSESIIAIKNCNQDHSRRSLDVSPRRTPSAVCVEQEEAPSTTSHSTHDHSHQDFNIKNEPVLHEDSASLSSSSSLIQHDGNIISSSDIERLLANCYQEQQALPSAMELHSSLDHDVREVKRAWKKAKVGEHDCANSLVFRTPVQVMEKAPMTLQQGEVMLGSNNDLLSCFSPAASPGPSFMSHNYCYPTTHHLAVLSPVLSPTTDDARRGDNSSPSKDMDPYLVLDTHTEDLDNLCAVSTSSKGEEQSGSVTTNVTALMEDNMESIIYNHEYDVTNKETRMMIEVDVNSENKSLLTGQQQDDVIAEHQEQNKSSTWDEEETWNNLRCCELGSIV